jgi:hypothetical protein
MGDPLPPRWLGRHHADRDRAYVRRAVFSHSRRTEGLGERRDRLSAYLAARHSASARVSRAELLQTVEAPDEYDPSFGMAGELQDRLGNARPRSIRHAFRLLV